ncbi:hypothetical protein SPB21_30375 [Leptothoe sp. ISB3NOV94-8A]
MLLVFYDWYRSGSTDDDVLIEVEDWRNYKTLVNELICQIEAYLTEPKSHATARR